MALDRDQIVQTALRLLDDVGFSTLSLRRLAKELDVHASALYWHFENKQELLDEMARAIMLEVVSGDDPQVTADSWDEWLMHLGRAQRQAVRTHRDGPLLMLAARPLADYQLGYLDWILNLLVSSGFSGQEAGQAFAVISNYALGTAIVEQQQDGVRLADVDGALDAHPGLASIAQAAADPDMIFESGLRWLVAGMRSSRASD
ncbi:TetR/AcrR family transcriptional regulator C-terminal domain-containing protein [Fodinicola feengrottensis]|uniref:TetR/AcrR family transcriptional regulator C-terminal domain-containing protein n=1 Tax=Fodinicola feengrottensis TaxID=435914 RepID=A0ABP4V4D8_9ACTN|nr:TetR/AcrR family transcriptional regulator C-terminal domain-containing protein [Fodinicola feengrottensis]